MTAVPNETGGAGGPFLAVPSDPVAAQLARLTTEVARLANIVDGWCQAAAEPAEEAAPTDLADLERSIRGQDWYTVVGVWAETLERFAEPVQAESARQAEDLVRMRAVDNDTVLWVAAVYEGELYAADKYATFADSPDRTTAVREVDE